jgi:uncharacterized Zn-finger protein
MTDKKPKSQKEIKKEIITVPPDADQVVCDGGGGPLGHPQVWYTFDKRQDASCHYCGRRFIKQAESADH